MLKFKKDTGNRYIADGKHHYYLKPTEYGSKKYEIHVNGEMYSSGWSLKEAKEICNAYEMEN